MTHASRGATSGQAPVGLRPLARHTKPSAPPAVWSSFTLAAEAWVEILACRARLRLPRLLAAEPFLRRELVQEPTELPAHGSMDYLVSAFGRGLRAQPGAAGCLPRSLALRRFLARHGHGSRLGLGLRKVAGRLGGHAWVEVAGTVVSDDEGFVRSFARLQIARRDRSAVPPQEG